MSDIADLKTMAYNLLRAHDVADLVFGFNPNSIIEAHGRKLVIAAKLEDLRTDRMDGDGVSRFTLSTLGHLVSKIMYMLGWKKDERRKVVQNNLAYVHLQDPSPGEDVYILATYLHSQSGIDHLHFAIESDPKKKLVYGTGSSSLAIFKSRGSSTREAEGEKSRRDGSSRQEASPSLPAGLPTSASAALQPAASNSTKPETSVGVGSEARLEPGQLAKTSILRRPSSDGFSEAKRRRRHVSFAELDSEKEKRCEYMLVNVVTRLPKTDKTLEAMLAAIGVTREEYEEVRYEALPIAKINCFVFFFTVTTSTGCSKVDNTIDVRQWAQRFHIGNLCSPTSEPFISTTLHMESIIATIFLSQRYVHRYELNADCGDLIEQLNDKDLLASTLKDPAVRKQVMAALNKRGAAIVEKKLLEPAASK
ncbi:unnamed protein product [Caenorhabditis brenneri]